VGFDGSFWIDHNFPFGLTTAGGVQGHVADATVDILHAMDISPIKKWVDDHAMFRFPVAGGVLGPDGTFSSYEYLFDLLSVFDATRPLGIPWHPEKCSDFNTVFTYLGFLWDLVARSVSLPDAKHLKYLAKLEAILVSLSKSPFMSHKDALSIHGTLSHVAFVIPHGWAFLSNISRFTSLFPPETRFARRKPPPSVISDLKWWRDVLSTSPPPRILTPRGPPQDIDLWVDASTDWGIGITLGDQWDAWRTTDRWRGEGRDIGWLEAIAVEMAVLTLYSAGWKDRSVLIHSDNQGVIGAFKHGRSRNFQVNLCIRRVQAIAMESNMLHHLSYTESLANKADPVSRGETGPVSSRLPPFQLPAELVPFIVPYV
jgi:hypothetical protein